MDGSEALERAIEIAVEAHAGQLYPALDGERGPYVLQREEDTYEAYIEALAPNALAREVKLADLADNLATNLGLPPSPANAARIARYEAALKRLK